MLVIIEALQYVKGLAGSREGLCRVLAKLLLWYTYSIQVGCMRA